MAGVSNAADSRAKAGGWSACHPISIRPPNLADSGRVSVLPHRCMLG